MAPRLTHSEITVKPVARCVAAGGATQSVKPKKAAPSCLTWLERAKQGRNRCCCNPESANRESRHLQASSDSTHKFHDDLR